MTEKEHWEPPSEPRLVMSPQARLASSLLEPCLEGAKFSSPEQFTLSCVLWEAGRALGPRSSVEVWTRGLS